MSVSQPTSQRAPNNIETALVRLFCKKYGLTRLVLVEPHDDITLAIAREKAFKAWKREWKIRLVEESNPGWRDMSDVSFWLPETPAFAGVTIRGTAAFK